MVPRFLLWRGRSQQRDLVLLSLSPAVRGWGRRNRRLEQDQVAARLAFVEGNNGVAAGCEREAFGLAAQIAQPPSGGKRGNSTSGPEVVDPRDGGRLIAEQVEPAIGTDIEIAEVFAGSCQRLVGNPHCTGHECLITLRYRPLGAFPQRPTPYQP